MDLTILLFLLQDGLTSGAIYALLGLALVLVFTVTKVIFIPQGEFVAYGALTMALLDQGRVPGTVWLLVAFAAVALLFELWGERHNLGSRLMARLAVSHVAIPAAIVALTMALAPMKLGPVPQALLTVLMIAPMGPYLYRFAFQPLAETSVLVLLIAAVGAHWSMTGLSLLFFGPEGLRAEPLSRASWTVGPLPVSGQSIAVYAAFLLLMVALYFFFDRTLTGKALKATAVNRLGAKLVGIPTASAGSTAFLLAAIIGAASGVLIAPITTIYYDTGFLIGLKGFVAAILGGLASYPLTALAAILVGLIEAFASFHASAFKEIIVFMLVLPALLIRALTTTQIDDEEDH
jgi:branched-chain amino acid transport system permease protein